MRAAHEARLEPNADATGGRCAAGRLAACVTRPAFAAIMLSPHAERCAERGDPTRDVATPSTAPGLTAHSEEKGKWSAYDLVAELGIAANDCRVPTVPDVFRASRRRASCGRLSGGRGARCAHASASESPHSNLTAQAARRRMRQHGCRRRALPPHPGVVALEELAVTLEVGRRSSKADRRPRHRRRCAYEQKVERCPGSSIRPQLAHLHRLRRLYDGSEFVEEVRLPWPVRLAGQATISSHGLSCTTYPSTWRICWRRPSKRKPR
jgi:hypothetical protein